MLAFAFHRSHLDTHAGVAALLPGCDVRVWSYDRLLTARTLPFATYVFGDFDRLSSWECELAARVRGVLAAAGMRVLNDPARSLQRFELLRRLSQEGLNDFRVWRAGDRDGPDPNSYPVFLRTASAHRGAATDLLHTPEEVAAATDAMLAEGVPEREIMIVEYAAEEIRPGLFRKLAAFRIGDRIVPTLSVHDPGWHAKRGVSGSAGADLYDEEHALLLENPHAVQLMRAFELARIDYGRADYSLVRGRVQVYEINSNPKIRRVKTHAFPRRLESDALWRRNVGAALAVLDAGPGPAVAIDDPALVAQRRRDGWLGRSRGAI